MDQEARWYEIAREHDFHGLEPEIVAAIRQAVEPYRDALHMLATFHNRDGGDCWCREKDLGLLAKNQRTHDAVCMVARQACWIESRAKGGEP